MASRICPKCGQEAAGTAKFCSQCSASLIGEPSVSTRIEPAGKTSLEVAAAKSKVLLISALSLTVVVLAAVAIYSLNRFSSVVRASPPVLATAPPVVQAPAPVQVAPSVVQSPAPAQSAPPVTQAPTTPAVTPPAAVVAYLSFIQQMENNRNALEAAQVAAVLPLLATANGLKTDTDESQKTNGVDQINQAMTANLAKWQGLIKQFQAQTPPAGCQDLGNDYYKLLEDYTDLSSQIQVALENGDTAKVMSLQSAQSIVDQDALEADNALSDVCTKFNAKKDFVISGEGGGNATPVTGI